MYHFFVEPCQIVNHTVTITGPDVNHIKNVLRMKAGEKVSVSNGVDLKEYRCEIEKIEEDRILLHLLFVKEDQVELPSKIFLFQGLPKADKMEWIIQKAVELGAFEIIPVATGRSVVKLDAKKAAAKGVRWNAIAESAAKQSKRGVIPKVKECMNFEQALEYASSMDVKIIPYELAEKMTKTREIVNGITGGQTIAVFIGPEGGFTEDEIEKAAGKGIRPVTLGRRILRTETAGLTVLSWLMYHLECDE